MIFRRFPSSCALTVTQPRNYIVVMKARIVRIGNSRGVRIPKALLEHTRLGEEVEIEARDEQIVIRSAYRPRAGWEEAFRLMSELGDDKLPDWHAGALTSWDEDDWQWE